ncbi:MAG: hypothetical protein HYV09_03270 [Deltaproteobacteria bacterium]|nr:hypothetical protein [Deltaproteobacteria bacterium]
MSDNDAALKEKTRAILLELAEPERRLLSAVLRVERDHLHMKRPHGIKEALMKAVREVLK